MIEIEYAKEKDFRVLAKMDRIAYEEMKVWTLQTEKDFLKSLRKKDSYFLIAYSGKEPIGYIETEFDSPKEIVWIKNIFVLRKYRKRDIARKLIQKTTVYWKRKTRLIVLLTADKNLKIFEKLGFRKTANYLMQEI